MREQNRKSDGMGAGEQYGKIWFIIILIALLLPGCEKNTTSVNPAEEPLIISDVTAPVVNSVLPANNAVSVATGTTATVTFNEAMNAISVTSLTFILKQGTTTIPGTVACTGKVAVFTPATPLTTNKLYTGTVTNGVKDSSGNALAAEYTWNFTTAAAPDTQAPTIVSVVPANNGTAIPTNTKATITFSEAMNASTISASTITLKKGSTAVSGTVTYTGSVATFSPSAALSANTLYTGSVSTGVKDVAGNSLVANYTWSFTTAAIGDVTPPTVLSIVPASNATSVAAGSKATATFSETMDAASINATTFTLKQGSTAVTGTVTYSGTTATYTPSAALTGNTVYTATITTGVKDPSGNALAANYSWTFTTVAAAPTGKSFSTDVVPILNLCNTCHTHPWTTSSNASTFYDNLVSGGYVKPAAPTTSKIYTKINGGHPSSTVSTAQKNTILTWMTEGSKNN